MHVHNKCRQTIHALKIAVQCTCIMKLGNYHAFNNMLSNACLYKKKRLHYVVSFQLREVLLSIKEL